MTAILTPPSLQVENFFRFFTAKPSPLTARSTNRLPRIGFEAIADYRPAEIDSRPPDAARRPSRKS
jgi:hypothetical protein